MMRCGKPHGMLEWKTDKIPLMGSEPTPKDPKFREKLFSGQSIVRKKENK